MPPSAAISRTRSSSVTRPSIGVGSNLKSLEWRMRPCGVSNTVIRPLGVEWVTGRNSQSNGPMGSRAWSSKGIRSGTDTPAAFSLPRTIPRVNGAP